MARKFRINQEFFDEESEKRDYFIGAFCGSYISIDIGRIIFRSSHKKLVEMIHDELVPDHALISDKRRKISDRRKRKSSHWIDVYNLPILHLKLGEFELNIPKSKRQFPKNIRKKYLHHLIRGFFDSKANIFIIDNKYTNIRIDFNPLLLSELQEILERSSGARGKLSQEGSNKSFLFYGHNDSIKIHDFIYQDFRLIKRQGIYLPSKKQLFNKKYVADYSGLINYYGKIALKTEKKVEKAKKLLAKGNRVADVAKEVGYSQSTPLCIAFKRITGQTPTEWQKNLNSNN